MLDNDRIEGLGLISRAMNFFGGVKFFHRSSSGEFEEVDAEYLTFPCIRGMKRKMNLRVLALISCFIPSSIIADELDSVPQHLIGTWVEQLSTEDYDFLCRPGFIQITRAAIIDRPKDCGEGGGGRVGNRIVMIVEEAAWFGDKVTDGFVTERGTVGTKLTYVFETRERSLDAFVYMTESTESWSRPVGVFKKRVQ